MARMSLPPGFRFHPTDVELVMYYLKRKLMGKKFIYEAISELNIYKFCPWDLPDQSCLRTKDLEWFFFCPREKKFASGARMNRATESGFWKTTGKDRPVIYKEKRVGSIRTLVFHSGHAPCRERTDWVMHEYRIVDTDLADAGVPLDAYVLCKVFHKMGLGPKIGAQYGAPFNEEEWDDDTAIAVDGLSTVATVPSNNLNSSEITSVTIPHSDYNCSLTELGPSTGPATNEVLPDMPGDDDVASMLAMFTDEPMLSIGNDNNEEHNYTNPDQVMVPVPHGNDIHSGLGDLGDSVYLNDGNMSTILESGSFLEIIDLETPLEFPAEAHQLEGLPAQIWSPPFDSGGHFGNNPLYASNFVGTVQQHSPLIEQPPLLEGGSFWPENDVNISQQEYGIAAIANQGYNSSPEGSRNITAEAHIGAK